MNMTIREAAKAFLEQKGYKDLAIIIIAAITVYMTALAASAIL